MSLSNQSHITNFRLDVPDGHATDSFLLNVQTASIPGFRLNVTDMPLGIYGLARASVPGAASEFEPLIVRVLADENLESYLQVYQWMISLNDYAKQDPTMWGKIEQPRAMQLHVLNNNKTDIVATFNYHKAWPSELSEIEYSYTEEGDLAVTFTVTFHYAWFDIEKDGQIIRPRGRI